ncbi:MAG TPA: FAD-binding oxidoreductase [Smithellaceae bacterium]|nr:FAD-binding oxidoreductase [Smithellaceae bacterium]HPG53717.1 FAD-binding oxidoreductase [Smithellaceae bacterium]HPM70702.1 FAD-binding oxidoreductase [Smithellaceae bacterium]HQQ86784.1 FAD-binding oxidoreductase [Smithellaceae bacterium]
MTESSRNNHPLYSEIRSIVGPEHVTVDEFSRRAYTRAPFVSMGAGGRGKTPGIAVRPGSTEEIAEIVKLANKSRIPIVPRGGGGSVSPFPPVYIGGDDNILLDTQRLNRINIDTEYMTVTAECGVILSALAETVRKKGFQVHTVDVPIHMDSVGGVLSGFVGGGEPSDVASSGTMNTFLLGLKVVLPTGEIIQTGGGPGTNIHQEKFLHREAGGPDMTGMFIGDGGAFGIKTEATFNIFPQPSIYLPGITDMGGDENMWKAFDELIKTAPYPYTRLLSFREGNGPWYFVHVIRAHSQEEADAKKKILQNICRKNGGKAATVGDQIMQIAGMFSARRLGQQTLPVGSTMTYFGEALVPKPRSLEYLKELNALLDETVGDLDIYKRVDFVVPYLRATTITGILLYFGKGTTRDEASQKMAKTAVKRMEELFTKYGGWTETHQGTSFAHTASAWSPTYKSFMQAIKKTLDPNDILMPGLWRI